MNIRSRCGLVSRMLILVLLLAPVVAIALPPPLITGVSVGCQQQPAAAAH